MPPISRGSTACAVCHKKKVKCDLTDAHRPCTNCKVGKYTCRPHERKRKRYSLSPTTHEEDVRSKPPEFRPPANHGTAASSELETTTTLVGGTTVSPQPSIAQNHTLYETPTTEQSYVGRSEYLDGHVPFTEDGAVAQANPGGTHRENELSELDVQFLTLRKALDLPPRIVRESLVDAFMERCHPWTPIVERRWLDDTAARPPSVLLLQAVFLAGSRVLSSPVVHTSSSEFYERARALFFHGHETNTTLAIVAVCLLQWWNPTGPEKFSTNTSGFWVRIGTELAYQVGLHKEPADGPFKSFRRRLWWSLVTRDSIISVGTGRPRTINMEDSSVRPPSVADFANQDIHAHLFVAYVSVCRSMGDITEAQRRQALTPSRKQRLEDGLFRWLKELPSELQITQVHRASAPYNFEARQLAVQYFISLVLLHTSRNPQAAVPTECLMASSFVVSIFEEFLSRDQLRYLGPVFAFYALAAGLAQLTAYQCEALKPIVEGEFEVVNVALEELGKRWGSAHGALRALIRTKEALQRQANIIPGYPPPLTSSAAIFFKDFGPELCRMWGVGFPGPETEGGGGIIENIVSPRLSQSWEPNGGAMKSSSISTPNAQGSSIRYPPSSSAFAPMHAHGVGDQFGGGGGGVDEMALFEDPLAFEEGSWLLEGFDLGNLLTDAVGD